MYLERLGCRKGPGEVGGGESMIRIYYVNLKKTIKINRNNKINKKPETCEELDKNLTVLRHGNITVYGGELQDFRKKSQRIYSPPPHQLHL